jgi:EpsD family peptidyl-prolyl cis-trans isomerase
MLSGCDQVKKLVGGGKPSGQVVATVDGKEITNLQLRSEMVGFASNDPQVMKAAQQQVLQRMILRKLLAEEAKKQKLDKTADYTLQVQRGQETLLAQLYERKLASKVTQPSRADAEAFVAANPNLFANRQVLFVDQLIAAPNKIPSDQFKPLNTLPAIKALLDSNGVQYQENAAILDSLNADPRLVQAVQNLKPGEVFAIPQRGGTVVFNQVATSRTAPLTGNNAIAYAMNILRNQRAQQSVAKQIADLRKAAESRITYNPAYKPPPPKAPAAKAAAPAPAPAPAPAAPAAEPAPAAAPATK